MKRRFIRCLTILMIISFGIMAVTGIMFASGYHNHFAGEFHKITGLVFIGLIIIHIIVFHKVAYSFLFNTPHKKQ